ncbi:MAG: hypothetical protein K2Y27_24995 [Xanthobacteraceae bacterium]|nr:hypothetical protein [Xanthobacteraceae bacterium]
MVALIPRFPRRAASGLQGFFTAFGQREVGPRLGPLRLKISAMLALAQSIVVPQSGRSSEHKCNNEDRVK